jgi:hypothetical protein
MRRAFARCVRVCPVKLWIEDELTREYDRDGKILELRGVDVDG